MMPFENEVGRQPSLKEMKSIVTLRKQRPHLNEAWLQHESLSQICTTVEECWDQDPEARLSAECVVERLLGLQKTIRPRSIVTSMPTISHLPTIDEVLVIPESELECNEIPVMVDIDEVGPV
jgi:hypothetical protein